MIKHLSKIKTKEDFQVILLFALLLFILLVKIYLILTPLQTFNGPERGANNSIETRLPDFNKNQVLH